MSVGTLYQTTTPAEGVTDFLSRLLDPAGAYGEGLYWTGSGTVGSSYPPFLALVRDNSGRPSTGSGQASGRAGRSAPPRSPSPARLTTRPATARLS